VAAGRGGLAQSTVENDTGRGPRCRQSARRATTYQQRNRVERFLNVHQNGGGSSNGGSGRRQNIINNENVEERGGQYMKVGLEDAKEWMERRLSKFKSGIPKKDAARLASDWQEGFNQTDIDHRIIEIEAAQIAKQYERWHVPRLGNMQKERPAGVFRLFVGQLNGAASEKVRDVKVDQIKRVLNEWDVQGGGVSEVGINWLSYPSSYSLSSWFISDFENMKSSVAFN